MGNRMLRDWTNSDKIDSISCEAERFFTRLIMKADDYGCFWGDAKRLKANLYPLKSDSIREADILRWKAECQKAGLIVIYESDGKDYVQIIDFDQRLRLRKQKFPLPEQSQSGKDGKNEAYVYFIASKNDESVKIGFSLNPWARVKELSTGSHHSLSVIGAFKGLMEDEKEIHSIFKKIRIKGEWFGISKQLKYEIESCYSSNYTAKQLIEHISSNYVADSSNYVAKRSVPEVEVEVEEKEEKDTPGSEIKFPITRCLQIANMDSKWLNTNKPTKEEITEFMTMLTGTGEHEKNPADFKSHFFHWKKKRLETQGPVKTGRRLEV